jgi:hypothetical protein
VVTVSTWLKEHHTKATLNVFVTTPLKRKGRNDNAASILVQPLCMGRRATITSAHNSTHEGLNHTDDKAKAVPLHVKEALGGDEVFSTSALDGGVWSASRPGRALTPGKRPPPPQYPLYRRLGEPHGRSGHRGYRKNTFASAGDRTSIAPSSVRRQTLY